MVWADLVTRTNKPTMLFPTSKVANRTWPATYWVELAWLLKERGEHPMIFVLEKDEKWNTAPNYAFGFDINHLAALMLRCKRVICNDSMAAHLAGNMNAKATVLAGPTNHNIFSHCPSVRVMHSKRYDCSPCCYKEPFRGSCDLGCHALYGLFPADVLAAL
jgi:ADP-heptose:LPS heptosyltransferase